MKAEGVIKISNSSICYQYTNKEMAFTSITAALINTCLCHIHNNGCNEISYKDYTRIKNGAMFLVRTHQVLTVKDIDLDAILECFNDTDLERKYI